MASSIFGRFGLRAPVRPRDHSRVSCRSSDYSEYPACKPRASSSRVRRPRWRLTPTFRPILMSPPQLETALRQVALSVVPICPNKALPARAASLSPCFFTYRVSLGHARKPNLLWPAGFSLLHRAIAQNFRFESETVAGPFRRADDPVYDRHRLDPDIVGEPHVLDPKPVRNRGKELHVEFRK